jgi:hypothetical protein
MRPESSFLFEFVATVFDALVLGVPMAVAIVAIVWICS